MKTSIDHSQITKGETPLNVDKSDESKINKNGVVQPAKLRSIKRKLKYKM